MKNAIRKITASVICGALLIGSTAGCADTSWSVKNDDETLSVGTYIYYLTEAYSEAKEKTGKSGDAVLTETIDKKTGDEWIRDRAKELCVEQLTLDKLCKDNKIELTDADIDASYIDKSAFYGYYSYSDMWIMSKQNYEAMGISEDSYKNAVIKTALAKNKLFSKLYDEGGTQAVSDEELKKYFTENYVNYQYFTTSLNSTDDEGNSVTMSDEEKEVVKLRYERYADIINEQGGTTDDVVEQYNKDYPPENTNSSAESSTNESSTESSSAESSANESSTESSSVESSANESSTESSSAESSANESSTENSSAESSANESSTESSSAESSANESDTSTENDVLQTATVDLSSENFVDGKEVQEKLKTMKEGEAAYVATSSEYFFLYKLPIADQVNTALSKDDPNSYRSSVLHSIKDEDFEKYIEEQAGKLKYEQNDSAFSKYTPSRVIPDSDNSVESSEEESSTESTTSTESEASTESTASTANESSTESTTSTANESSTESTTSTVSETSKETSISSAPESSLEAQG